MVDFAAELPEAGCAVLVTVTVGRGSGVAVTVTVGAGAGVCVAVAVTVTFGRGAPSLAELDPPPPMADPATSSAMPPAHTRLRLYSGRMSGIRTGSGGWTPHG
ncbi:hypothetical protein [Streptomyces sp. NPDC026659]|uniref:hypothetical protein n=1 Tax=Streptomyces sp. NPDC026659 TaxID=3155123 RepID=UPI0033CC1B17